MKGFSQQHLIDVEEAAEMLNRLPAEHLQDLDDITFFPDSKKKVKAAYRTKKSHFWWGRALSLSHRIEIYNVNTKQEFYWSLFHELGHYVMDRKISASSRKQWTTKSHPRRGDLSTVYRTPDYTAFCISS